MKFISIGYGNVVAADRVVALVSPDSAPVKRLVQDARDAGRVIDVTCGRRTRAVIVTDSEHVILSAVQPETISWRLNGKQAEDDGEEEN
ncbi:MAG: DUF370 domain-containing protein [Ruminococcaceae bacterium]|nr:DUF370 domain-containing protein [Oscillospiraceae bacterium]